MAIPSYKRYKSLNTPGQFLLVKRYPTGSTAVYSFMFEVDGRRIGDKWTHINRKVLACMLEDYVEVNAKRSDRW